SLFREVVLGVAQGSHRIAAKGAVRTSLPLLKNAPIVLEGGGDRVFAGVRGDVSRIRPPIPGFRITTADRGVQIAPELKAEGKLGVAFGPASRPYADGTLTVTADENGLVATGDIVGHIPGIDDAKGSIEYRNK